VSSCNYGRNGVLSGTTTYLRCNDVAESFSDGAELYKGFMSFFIDCIRAEESIYRPACVGYRVFLSACFGVSSFLAAHISDTTVTLQHFTGPISVLLFTELIPFFNSLYWTCSIVFMSQNQKILPMTFAAFIKLWADTHEVDLNRVKLVSVFTVFGSELLLLFPIFPS
jgi:hypothetical protein